MPISALTIGVLLLAVAPSLTLAGDPGSATKAVELGTLLERAGQYVAEYENVSRDLVADETYRQLYWNSARALRARNLHSDVVFLMLPGSIRWTLFRDAYEVDGKKVRDRQARLERLFSESPATAVAKALAIVSEGARYNLGPVLRTVNVPPLALQFLHPDNQARFAFKRKGRCSIDDRAGVEVSFSETARPTLVRDEAREDVPTQGRLCIDPATGAVLRTDVEFDLDHGAVEHLNWARILVLYRRDAKLDAWVPAEMKETYQLNPTDANPKNPATHIEATARYTDFHRLQVSMQESFRPAPQPSP